MDKDDKANLLKQKRGRATVTCIGSVRRSYQRFWLLKR